MPFTRDQVCQSTSKNLSAAAGLKSIKAAIGLDGFVDEIIAVVDKRQDATHYQPVKTIAAMAKKIAEAAGQSNNFELVVKQRKLGGNGPIMANALACAGLDVTYIGNLGFPKIDPVFEEFAGRAKVMSIADAGHTDALEFEDGKLMLGKHQSLGEVNWDNLLARIGREKFVQMIADATLVGIVNWTMLPHLSDIWARLSNEIFPKLPKARRFFFADLCDPEKRTAGDLREAMNLLSQMQGKIEVILGLNLKEATQVAGVLGMPSFKDEDAALEGAARNIREKMKIACVVIHPRRGATGATADGKSAWIAGPFVEQPKISTGAGDHFNAGFCLGQVLGLSLEESLCCGVGTSGYYVRTAQSPTANQLGEFVAKLPPPQG